MSRDHVLDRLSARPDPATRGLSATGPATRPATHVRTGRVLQPERGGRLTRPVLDPGSGAVIAHVACTGPAELDAALHAARSTIVRGAWARTSVTHRARLLHRFALALDDRAEEFARLEALDAGTPITLARSWSVPTAVELVRHRATSALRLSRPTAAPPEVSAVLVPAAFPLVALTSALADVLVTGGTAVVLTAPDAPMVPLLVSAVLASAGIPAGVVQVFAGDTASATHLRHHPDVDRCVTAAAHGTDKVAGVVTADANIDALLASNPFGGAGGSGTYAVGYHRLRVHASRRDELLAALEAAVPELRVGRGPDPATRIGPLSGPDALDDALDLLRSGVRAGAEIVTGGTRAGGPLASGYFLQPTVLAATGRGLLAAAPSVTVPLLPVLTYTDDDVLLPGREGSLFAGTLVIWSRDVATANRFATALGAGRTYVNSGPLVAADDVWRTTGRLRPSS